MTLVASAGLVLAAAAPAEAATFVRPDERISISNAGSGKCLDVRSQDGFYSDYARVQQWKCTNAREQVWSLRFAATYSGANYFYVYQNNSGKCMEVAYGAVPDGAQVDQVGCGLSANQLWKPVPAGYGRYVLINYYYQKCLDLWNGSSRDGTKIQLWECNGSLAQYWVGGSANPHACDPYAFVGEPPSTLYCDMDYRRGPILGAAYGTCLDVRSQDDYYAPGAAIQVWACSGALEQGWYFRYVVAYAGVAYYQIVSDRSGLCLQVRDNASGEGAQIEQNYCGYGYGQVWRTRYDPSSGSNIINNFGKCLSTVGWANGTMAQQYNCNGGSGQRFYLWP